MTRKTVQKNPHSKQTAVRRDCPSCGVRVSITAADDWRCPECTTAFCPFCKTSVLDRCEHVVASLTADQWWVRVFVANGQGAVD